MDIGTVENLNAYWRETPEFKAALTSRTLPLEGPVVVKINRDYEDHFTLWFEYCGIVLMIADGCPLRVGHQAEIKFPTMALNQLLTQETEERNGG